MALGWRALRILAADMKPIGVAGWRHGAMDFKVVYLILELPLALISFPPHFLSFSILLFPSFLSPFLSFHSIFCCSVSFSLSLLLSFSPSLFLSFVRSFFLSFLLSQSPCLSVSFFLSFFLAFFLSVFLWFFLSLSLFIGIYIYVFSLSRFV